MKFASFFLVCIALVSIWSCKKDTIAQPGSAKVKFKFRFDPNQERLNNLGLPATVPTGNSALTPSFHQMAVHYIELAPSPLTALGTGAILYRGPEVSTGGSSAIDFNAEILAPNDSIFMEIPVSSITPGTYTWIRASAAYQNYDIQFSIRNINIPPYPAFDLTDQTGRVASFVGFNTYISSYKINSQSVAVNANKLQGYWGFEPHITSPITYNTVSTGQAPANATTVPNPLFSSSPIPAGSCVITGQFLAADGTTASPLVITGQETSDITVTLSFSINHSFEWVDHNGNGKLDFDYSNPSNSDVIVDMGLRGLKVFRN